MGTDAARPAQPARPPAQEDRPVRTWRDDPDRYLRQVKGGRIQARPYDPVTRTRVNLGTFATKAQARAARDRYWWGRQEPKPKFVRCSRNQFSHDRGDPPRFFVLIPTAGDDGKRAYKRVGEWFASEAEAVAARDRFLVASYGRHVAAAMVSRADTSRRAGRY